MQRKQTSFPANWILAGTIIPSSMAFIDATALNVALPFIQKELELTASGLIWIINSYAIFLSSLMLVAGAVGDALGRKKVFMAGIIVFTIASILCGISTEGWQIIAFRCLQGIGGAMMLPGSLSIINSLFPENKAGSAIGTWSMMSAAATISGPVLGGWFAGIGLWRYIFFMNVPLAIASLIILHFKVPESKAPRVGRIDYEGALLGTLGLSLFTFGIIEAPEFGFKDVRIQLSVLVGVILLFVFFWYEGKAKNPMIPLTLFKNKNFTFTNFSTLLIYAGLGGFLFFLPLNFIQIQKYPGELVGMMMLPFAILISLFSRISGRLSDKFGIRLMLIFGPVITASGYLYISNAGLTGSVFEYWTAFFPGIFLLGLGMGCTVVPLTTAVMTAVKKDNSGVASGVNNTVARTASVLAVAAMGLLMVFIFKETLLRELKISGMGTNEIAYFREEAIKLADISIPENIHNKEVIKQTINNSFLKGFISISRVSASLCFLAAIIAVTFIKDPRK